jgi:putative membrane protein
VLQVLPHLNASLNALTAILLTIGWVLIKNKRIEAHKRFMIAAFISSLMFFTSYITYHAQIGSKPFPGTGTIRTVYYSILIPHVTMAAIVLPMAIVTFRRGLRRDDVRHKRLARITFPIWMFVSVTGVIVYLMNYQMF